MAASVDVAPLLNTVVQHTVTLAVIRLLLNVNAIVGHYPSLTFQFMLAHAS